MSDPDKQAAKAYGVVHEGREFPERWTFYIGEDGKILHVDKKVSVGSHGDDIAKRLKELGVKAR